ncbi:MAG TPA: metallophosphoesterase family protein [Acidimicrobiales bacterium]|nr:metallophosphoesterase family protein [Acidimicrobiales bacterium]
MRVAVLADTHLRRGIDGLSARARQLIEAADVVLHAGDVTSRSTLDSLAEVAPLHAVLGNNDVELVGLLPVARVVELADVRVAMIHDSGPRAGRAARLRRQFPTADVVVFGHSHIPWNEEGLDGQLLFNPGSPTQRRAQPVHTVGELELVDGTVAASRIVTV